MQIVSLLLSFSLSLSVCLNILTIRVVISCPCMSIKVNWTCVAHLMVTHTLAMLYDIEPDPGVIIKLSLQSKVPCMRNIKEHVWGVVKKEKQ